MTEGEVIRILATAAGGVGGPVRVGIGDDAAVLRPSDGAEWIVTQDALVEDVHFRRRWMDPESLGWKAMAVSVSDLAAMGAEPRAALLTLALPDDLGEGWVRGVARGVARCLGRYGVRLAGGDTVRSPDRIFLDGVLMGETPQGLAVTRGAARAGDRLVVTGSLGGAALGLELLEQGAEGVDDRERAAFARLRGRLLRPMPRVGAGLTLRPVATAMADLSDGLAGAVTAICEASDLGVILDGARLPIDPVVRKRAAGLGRDPLALAVWGGEEYELLFTAPAEALVRLPRRLGGVHWTEIGELVPRAEERILLRDGMREDLGHGYDAFRES